MSKNKTSKSKTKKGHSKKKFKTKNIKKNTKQRSKKTRSKRQVSKVNNRKNRKIKSSVLYGGAAAEETYNAQQIRFSEKYYKLFEDTQPDKLKEEIEKLYNDLKESPEKLKNVITDILGFSIMYNNTSLFNVFLEYCHNNNIEYDMPRLIIDSIDNEHEDEINFQYLQDKGATEEDFINALGIIIGDNQVDDEYDISDEDKLSLLISHMVEVMHINLDIPRSNFTDIPNLLLTPLIFAISSVDNVATEVLINKTNINTNLAVNNWEVVINGQPRLLYNVTPIAIAAMNGNMNILKMLIEEHGAVKEIMSYYIDNNNGVQVPVFLLPAELANIHGHTEVRNYLLAPTSSYA